MLKRNVLKYKAKKVWLKYIFKATDIPVVFKPQGGWVGKDNIGTTKFITT